MTVGERMTREVVTLCQDQSLRDAIDLFQRHRIRHIPVLDGEQVVGIVTDRDIKRATPSLLSGIDQEQYNKVLDETQVGQVMTRNPYTVTPSMSLRDAVKVLVDRKFGVLPVVEKNRLVGILTDIDLLRAFYEILDQ
ncbi:MAG: CBS domain-containing protein [Acidobacteriota bacterium]